MNSTFRNKHKEKPYDGKKRKCRNKEEKTAMAKFSSPDSELKEVKSPKVSKQQVQMCPMVFKKPKNMKRLGRRVTTLIDYLQRKVARKMVFNHIALT